jgi:HTH-type transcriptional regulator, sugar sensing transcriptional regulator
VNEDAELDLEELGLLPAEAQIYLALVRNGPLGASAIANVTKVPRSSVYPTLNALIDKGLVEGGAGYGSRFSAVRAELALPTLIRREKEELLHRESVAKKLTEHLSSLAEPVEAVPEELIEVIRNPRAVAERFERLELEAERQIDIFTKPPFFIAAANRAPNPALEKALRRGVRSRSLYEKATLDDPGIKPYLTKWIAAGEEARIYDGELPHKMVIFDSQVVLMPLFLPGEQMRALLIRNAQLAQSLSLAFQYVWDRSEPVASTSSKASAKQGERTDHAGQRISRNGRRSHAKK